MTQIPSATPPAATQPQPTSTQQAEKPAHAQQNESATAPVAEESDGFGPSYILSISDAAQANIEAEGEITPAVPTPAAAPAASQPAPAAPVSNSSDSESANTPAAGGGAPKGSGGAPMASTEEDAMDAAIRKLQSQGIDMITAKGLVDDEGNIDYAKLAKLLAE